MSAFFHPIHEVKCVCLMVFLTWNKDPSASGFTDLTQFSFDFEDVPADVIAHAMLDLLDEGLFSSMWHDYHYADVSTKGEQFLESEEAKHALTHYSFYFGHDGSGAGMGEFGLSAIVKRLTPLASDEYIIAEERRTAVDLLLKRLDDIDSLLDNYQTLANDQKRFQFELESYIVKTRRKYIRKNDIEHGLIPKLEYLAKLALGLGGLIEAVHLAIIAAKALIQ